MARGALRETLHGLAALMGWSGGGRPKRTPCAFARARPAPVLARISSRSNSASPPSAVSISRPCGVVVSAQASPSDLKAAPAYPTASRMLARRQGQDHAGENGSGGKRLFGTVVTVRGSHHPYSPGDDETVVHGHEGREGHADEVKREHFHYAVDRGRTVSAIAGDLGRGADGENRQRRPAEFREAKPP